MTSGASGASGVSAVGGFSCVTGASRCSHSTLLVELRFSLQPEHTFASAGSAGSAVSAVLPVLRCKCASNCSHNRLFEPKTRTPASHCSQSTLLRQQCRRDQRWCRRPFVTLVKPMLFHTFLHQWASRYSHSMFFEGPLRRLALKPMEFHNFVSLLNANPTYTSVKPNGF